MSAETFIFVDSQGDVKGKWYMKGRWPILEMQEGLRQVTLDPTALAIWDQRKNIPGVWLQYNTSPDEGYSGQLLLFNEKEIGKEIKPEWTE